MFCHQTRLSFFACQKDAAGAALKKAAPAQGSGQQKNRLRLHPQSGGAGSATLQARLINIIMIVGDNVSDSGQGSDTSLEDTQLLTYHFHIQDYLCGKNFLTDYIRYKLVT